LGGVVEPRWMMDLQPATNVNSGAVLLQQQLRKTLREREREREREI